MQFVFADANYWIASANRNDQHFESAIRATEKIGRAQILTTTFVIAEFFNFYSERGDYWRGVSHTVFDRIKKSKVTSLIHISDVQFFNGIRLHQNRLDKGYSLTDCLSMVVMHEANCQEALTNDQHFEQEGFTLLMKTP